VSLNDLLIKALLAIYSRAGTEVTYVTDRGERRPYWANRYLQAVKRAAAKGPDAVIEFVERLMNQPEPSRGFFYLKDAGRLDLSVEALVTDRSQPFHQLFSSETVAVAEARLSEHGYSTVADAPKHGDASPAVTDASVMLGGKRMTTTASWWYLTAVNGLRADQVQSLDDAIEKCRVANGAAFIGGNHVLQALLDTDLYTRVWPGANEATA
jgi:hypothetical protein